MTMEHVPQSLFCFRNKIKVVSSQTKVHDIVVSVRSAPMSDSQTEPKTYSSPKINKVTPEQAKLLLLGQATQGDQGAKDLLDVLFPDRTNTKGFPHASTGKDREVS